MTVNQNKEGSNFVPSFVPLNNPFNLRKTNISWLGEVVGALTGSNFETFSTLEMGVRAGLKNLENGYFTKMMNLRQIISRYAPATENNTESYIRFVSVKTGIPENGYVTGKKQKLAFACAVARFETGKDLTIPINITNEKYKIFN